MHVIFMMATTQPEDIPQTIRSRCQHFSFHAVKFDDILAQLKMIAAEEKVEAEEPRWLCWPRLETALCATRSPSWPGHRLRSGGKRPPGAFLRRKFAN